VLCSPVFGPLRHAESRRARGPSPSGCTDQVPEGHRFACDGFLALTPSDEASKIESAVQFRIAETFHSLQGEGTWAGTPMYFIRLAGCHVGRPQAGRSGRDFPWVCRTRDGQTFLCDTDFGVHREATLEELVAECGPMRYVCLTGGEPLDQQDRLGPLMATLHRRGVKVHLETSGTVVPVLPFDWVTVSPKAGALETVIVEADEVKYLVDAQFEPAWVIEPRSGRVFLQPINGWETVAWDNVQRCLEHLRHHPTWRLSTQLHKLLQIQ